MLAKRIEKFLVVSADVKASRRFQETLGVTAVFVPITVDTASTVANKKITIIGSKKEFESAMCGGCSKHLKALSDRQD